MERAFSSKHLGAWVVGGGDGFHAFQLVNAYRSLEDRERTGDARTDDRDDVHKHDRCENGEEKTAEKDNGTR